MILTYLTLNGVLVSLELADTLQQEIKFKDDSFILGLTLNGSSYYFDGMTPMEQYFCGRELYAKVPEKEFTPVGRTLFIDKSTLVRVNGVRDFELATVRQTKFYTSNGLAFIPNLEIGIYRNWDGSNYTNQYSIFSGPDGLSDLVKGEEGETIFYRCGYFAEEITGTVVFNAGTVATTNITFS